MNHCDRCDIDIKTSSNCPICGRYCGESYTAKEYPVYTKNRQISGFVVHIIFWALLVVAVALTVCEILFLKKFNISLYFIVGMVALDISALLPIKHHWSFNGSISIVSIIICGLILFIELYSKTFGWGVYYVIPFFVLAITIYCLLTIIIKKYDKLDSLISLFILALISTALFVYNLVANGVVWPSISVFFASWGIIVTLFVIINKRTKREIAKNFHV